MSLGVVSTLSANAQQESELLQLARERDTQAFETLYRRHCGNVYGLCLRMLSDTGTAEDCTQETFVQAWKNLQGFKGESGFGTWLHRIAVNQVLMLRRRGQAQKRHLEAVGQDWAVDVTADPVSSKPASQMDLEYAVGSLPQGARDVFVLCAVNGYSYEETSNFLGVAVGTCKAQLHRARRLLKERLDR
ncbi:MAG: RNA polymerase sigma factor [Gammaproteobacteria bacterium]